ncbi:hypothetical protein G6L37_34775 [Agrobacterium rubi]|nr:hypothetical protein [Agrobacterium rubi]NTF23733.1 hypothetical protein [Agrobacterium rubi]
MTDRDIKPMPPEEISKLKSAIERRWDEKPWYEGGEGLGSPGCMLRAEEVLALIAAAEVGVVSMPSRAPEPSVNAAWPASGSPADGYEYDVDDARWYPSKASPLPATDSVVEGCSNVGTTTESLSQQIEAARQFVERHPALTAVDVAEFEAFLKVPAAIEMAMSSQHDAVSSAASPEAGRRHELSSEFINLERLAKAANAGPHHIYTHPRDDNNWKRNAEFHAAATPQIVLDLIAKFRDLVTLTPMQSVAVSKPVAWLIERFDNDGNLIESSASILEPQIGSTAETRITPLFSAIASAWRDMSSAPTNGRHCILAVKEGAYFYIVQGAFSNGVWNAVHRENVKPLCWMPNFLLPVKFMAPALQRHEG